MKRHLKRVVLLAKKAGQLLLDGQHRLLVERLKNKFSGAIYKRRSPASNDAVNERIDLLKYKLTELGYPERSLEELRRIVKYERFNKYLRARAAWEIIVWLMREQTSDSAKDAIRYIKYVRAYRRFSLSQQQRTDIMEAEALCLVGKKIKARRILSKSLDKGYNEDLILALANTYESLDSKIKVLNNLFIKSDLSALSLKKGKTPYDRLGNTSVHTDLNDLPKVSIIVPTYNAQDHLATTIDSIIHQSWTNLEIILVDDKSTDNTLKVMERYQKLDSRIKILKNSKNSGAYISRNNGLKEATGEFVTIFDADDWSHPDRILWQASALIDSPKSVIGNVSRAARVTDDMTFWRRNNPGYYIQMNMSSILLRRNELMEKFGYWDSVRFGADSELIHRIRRTLGEDSIQVIDSPPLAFVRQSAKSLTGDSFFGYNGFSVGARNIYNNCYRLHQQDADKNPSKMKYDFPQTHRPFYSPRPMNVSYQKNTVTEFDAIFVANLRRGDWTLTKFFTNELLKNSLYRGHIGLVDSAPYDTPTKQDITGKIRENLVLDTADIIVYGETVSTGFVAIDPKAIKDIGKFIPTINAHTCILVIDSLDEIDISSVKENAIKLTNAKEVFWCIKDRAIAANLDLKPLTSRGEKILYRTWWPATKGVAAGDYLRALDTNKLMSTKNPYAKRQEDYTDNIQNLRSSDIRDLDTISINSDIAIIMPSITPSLALETANNLVQRAGIDCDILVIDDNLRQGFIKTANSVFAKLKPVKYVVYLAEDALPGREWLKIAYDTLEENSSNLLGFNDGKWHGRIAAFGMARVSWLKTLYGGDKMFYDGYQSHACDNELTDIASKQNSYSYNPAAVLFENDIAKDLAGSNQYDYELYQQRKLKGFEL